MKSSQWDSASYQEAVAEGSSRPKGEQDDNEASSSDQAEWSYTHSISILTILDAHRLVDHCGMVITIPQELDRVHKPSRGHVTASKTFLKFGLRFPLHRFFRDILRFYRLTVFQVTPNGWAHMIGLFILFVEQKMAPPAPEEFSWLYILKSDKGDLWFFYFAKRAVKRVQVVTKIKESLGNWKDALFFTPEVCVRGRFGSPSKLSPQSFLKTYQCVT